MARRRWTGTTTQRGYGSGHQKLRAALLAVLSPGTPCPQRFGDGTTCGEPMWPGQDLHLGHTDDRAGYIGLVHAACNLRRAAEVANAARRPGRRRVRTAQAVTTGRRW
jgi:hypothetical protein